MPQTREKITREEFEQRIKDLLDLNEDKLKNITLDGKPLKQIIKEQNDKITQLEKEKADKDKVIEILKGIFGKENFKKDEKTGEEKYVGTIGSSTSTATPAGPSEAEKIKETFRKAFEGSNPSGLSLEQIDLWRTSDTGLSKNGTDERKVWDNHWKEPTKIVNKQIPLYSYNGKETKNVDVLKVNKDELNKVHDILVEIGTKKTFFELPIDYKGEKYKIAELKYNQLPDDTKKVIANAIQNQRNTFTYKVNVENNEKKGDGITSQNLSDSLKEIDTNKKKVPTYNPITSDFLNKFLQVSDLKISEVDEKGNPKVDKQKTPLLNRLKLGVMQWRI